MLTVLEHEKLKKWQKALLAAVLFYISATIGGWVIMPILYILVFYYVKDFKKQAAWVCGLTVLLQVFLIVAVELNRVWHFSKYDWPRPWEHFITSKVTFTLHYVTAALD